MGCVVSIGRGWSWSGGEGGGGRGGEARTTSHAIVVAGVFKIVGARIGGGSATCDELR